MANFQTALDALKNGQKVARKGWRHGFLFLACGLDFYTTAGLDKVFKKVGGQCDGKTDPVWHYDCGPAWDRQAICFCPRNANHGEITVGWLPKFDDLFAEDWFVISDDQYFSYPRRLSCPRDEAKEGNEEVNETGPCAKEEESIKKPAENLNYVWKGTITPGEARAWAQIIKRIFNNL